MKDCTGFDSVTGSFSCHGAGRYIDFIACRDFNAVMGFGTRISYTRFIDCHAETTNSTARAFDVAGGMQLPEDDNQQPSGDGEHYAFGGQNPLVGCEIINCDQRGYKSGLFRVCNMSQLIVRDCNVELPTRLEQGDPFYERCGSVSFWSPRRWQENWRYLPGDWVKDAWQVSGEWHYGLYECSATQPGSPPFYAPHSGLGGQYWVEIDGDEGHPSPLRGKLTITNCRFIHEGSGWLYNGIHPDWGFRGPYVFPELVSLDSVTMSPGRSANRSAMLVWTFRLHVRKCVARLTDGSLSQYALQLLMPGATLSDSPLIVSPPMKLDGVVTLGEVRIIDSELEGDTAPWDIDAGNDGTYSLVGSNLGNDGGLQLLGGLRVAKDAVLDGSLESDGSITSQARVKAVGGLAFGNAQDTPSWYPGVVRKAIKVYDMDGNELGYLYTYESEG